jgi:hypothetical protein
MTWRAETGAGQRAFRILPSGAETVIGSIEPVLFGISDPIAQRTPKIVYALV